MIKKTFSTVALLALAACQRQEPPASPPVAGSEPAPAGEAQPAAAAPPIAAAPALPPATPDERAKFVQSCWALFGAKDWQKFSSCYADNATSEQVDMGFPQATGRNDIVEKSTKPYAAAFPDGNGEHQLTLVNGNTVVSVVLFRGTNSGPLSGPTGTLPATNKKVGYLVGHVVELNDDGRSVARERFYFDAATMLGQLGVNPAPHRKVMEVGASEKPVVLASNSEIEKANLAAAPKGIESFNKHDVNAVLATWTDDGVFTDVSAPADTVGKQALKKSFTEFFKGFPDVKLEVTKSWAAGDYVVMEGTLTGTNTGDMPSMKLKKTGKKVSTRYLEVAKLQGGKIKNSWVFNNGMAFATQLGLVPPPGAKDSKAPAAAAPGSKDPKAAPAPAAAKDPKAAPAPAAKDSKAATPATPATPGAKPATPAAPAPTAAKPATPAAPAASAAKPAAPAAPAPAAPAAPAKK